MSYYTGQVVSDFMKLVRVDDKQKEALIDFTGSDFISIKENVIEYIKAVYPLDYQNFSESDLGIVLIEIIAYMGSVISMKTDMLANECFIRTSKNKRNVQKLLELIGVKMKGPLSAVANASLTFTENPGTDGSVIIPAANRNVTLTSIEDNASVSFTIYKTVNGALADADVTSDIALAVAESDGGANRVWSNLVIQEGSFIEENGEFTTGDAAKKVILDEESVIDGSIQVYISSDDSNINGAYTQVDSVYFASGGSDKIFEVSYDENYKATILFGDNNLGISPNINSTYKINYRVGGGSRGNLGVGALTNTLFGLGSNSVAGFLTNTDLATGGAGPETIEHAKKYAPLTFRRQDRVVTLDDFVTFANNFSTSKGTTGKATAAVRKAFSSANIIDLYVLEKASDLQLKKATISYKRELLDNLSTKKMMTDEVVVVDGLVRSLDFHTTIVIDREHKYIEETIKSEVRDKILTLFSVDNMSFGQTLYQSSLIRTLSDVDKVVYIKLDNLDSDIFVDFNEIIQLNNIVINVEYV